MAYRRRQGITRASTFKEEIDHPIDNGLSSSSASASSPMAAKAIRASSALRESSFSLDRHRSKSKEFVAYEDSSNSIMGDLRTGFWRDLARKAKAMLEDDIVSQQKEISSAQKSSFFLNNSNQDQFQNQPNETNEKANKADNHKFRKGLDAISTSLNHLGDTFEKAFEDGRTIVENKTADIIQETRKLQIKRQSNNSNVQYQADSYLNDTNPWQQPPQDQTAQTQNQAQTNHETQLKASRDVAMATATKAKLLLRELKTVKADLAFAKERCSQLEEENKILRDNRNNGEHREDDDLIRLQLETLLAEKARLANENSIYARENRFLREIVEYHQLTMQDIVHLDEGNEEVTEFCPTSDTSAALSRVLSVSPRSSTSEDLDQSETPPETQEHEGSQNQNQNQNRDIEILATTTSASPIGENAPNTPSESSM